MRVLFSLNARTWCSTAKLESPGEDLRDPKLLATPDGRLAVLCGARSSESGRLRLRTVLFERSAEAHWDPPRVIGDPGVWIWRLTFAPSGTALGLGYSIDPYAVHLYATRDLRTLETVVATLCSDGHPSEHGLAFLPGGESVCLLRRDPGSGLVGISQPPYREWSWKDLGVRIGGPCLSATPDGRLIAAVRLYDDRVRTSICAVEPECGHLEELLTLPSGGDTSYPGLAWDGEDLLVTYYSSHEGLTAIYLARVRFIS